MWTIVRLLLGAPLVGARAVAPCRPADGVVITCHGRSGSTLMERMFDVNADAISYYEPLRPWDLGACFNHRLRNRSLVMATIATLNCDLAARVPMQCPWHARLETLRLDSVQPSQIRALGGSQPRRRRAMFGQFAQQLRNTTASMPACRERLASCWGTVAAKIVRIPGMLDTLCSVAARASLRPAGRRLVVVHLIRDPRALLHSRYRVGWGIPKTKRPTDIARWAGKMCSLTLRDMRTGAAIAAGNLSGALYIEVRYEDLVRFPLESVRRVYGLIGRPVPPSVEAYFKAVVLRMRGGLARGSAEMELLNAVKGVGNARRRLEESAAAPQPGGLGRAQGQRGRRLWKDHPYATTSARSTTDRIDGWKRALSRAAIGAVQSRPKCRELMAALGYELLPV